MVVSNNLNNQPVGGPGAGSAANNGDKGARKAPDMPPTLVPTGPSAAEKHAERQDVFSKTSIDSPFPQLQNFLSGVDDIKTKFDTEAGINTGSELALQSDAKSDTAPQAKANPLDTPPPGFMNRMQINNVVTNVIEPTPKPAAETSGYMSDVTDSDSGVEGADRPRGMPTPPPGYPSGDPIGPDGPGDAKGPSGPTSFEADRAFSPFSSKINVDKSLKNALDTLYKSVSETIDNNEDVREHNEDLSKTMAEFTKARTSADLALLLETEATKFAQDSMKKMKEIMENGSRIFS